MSEMEFNELDRLIEDVVAEIANPAMSAGFERKVREGSLVMNATGNGNVLVFESLGRTSGRGMSKGSLTTAAVLNIAAALLLVIGLRQAHVLTIKQAPEVSLIAPPPPLPPSPKLAGGGGGQASAAPVIRGNPPKFAEEQIVPPKVPPLVQPKLAMEPTVVVQPELKMATTNLPTIGMPNAPAVGVGMGLGRGTGLGNGLGAGIGAGSGGNMGGGLRRVGGGVSAPVALYTPEPEFSEEARKAKVSGNVLVYLQVDTQGRPTHVRVLRGIGLGLDQKAVAAVEQYKFKPAMENGKAVPVEMQVEVNFQIY